MIGTKLAHYEITTHLGSGGMGDVYLATDTKLGRSVEIKVLPAAFASDADRLSRFRREAQVLAFRRPAATFGDLNFLAVSRDGSRFYIPQAVEQPNPDLIHIRTSGIKEQ